MVLIRRCSVLTVALMDRLTYCFSSYAAPVPCLDEPLTLPSPPCAGRLLLAGMRGGYQRSLTRPLPSSTRIWVSSTSRAASACEARISRQPYLVLLATSDAPRMRSPHDAPHYLFLVPQSTSACVLLARWRVRSKSMKTGTSSEFNQKKSQGFTLFRRSRKLPSSTVTEGLPCSKMTVCTTAEQVAFPPCISCINVQVSA